MLEAIYVLQKDNGPNLDRTLDDHLLLFVLIIASSNSAWCYYEKIYYIQYY